MIVLSIKRLVAVLCFGIGPFCISQTQPDTIVFDKPKFRASKLIVPGIFITYGVLSLESRALDDWDRHVRNQIGAREADKVKIDDFLQLAPAASVYALNAAGIKGKHNFNDRTVIIATALSLSMATTIAIKSAGNVMRPDLTTPDSFPSGHTNSAFTGAEFMWQEYRDVSVWYGISGYAMATATGILRIYNGRHWFSDVVMGAGIGILSTKTAYWLFPLIKKHGATQKRVSSLMSPFYDGRHAGVSAVWILN